MQQQSQSSTTVQEGSGFTLCSDNSIAIDGTAVTSEMAEPNYLDCGSKDLSMITSSAGIPGLP